MTPPPARLRTNHLDNPLGLAPMSGSRSGPAVAPASSVPAGPWLSWRSGDTRDAECQTAFQILAASHPSCLTEDRADRWDSGWIVASGACGTPYEGRPLRARERIWWTVRTRDSDGLASPFARPTYFEAGLDAEHWLAHWIGAAPGASAADGTTGGDRYVGSAPVLLYRDFALGSLPTRARLHLAVAGVAVIELNGEPLLRAEQLPLAGDYRSRVRVRTLDVGAQLKRGCNRLGVLLADGVYAGNRGWQGTRESFGQSPLVKLQLELEDAKGSLTRTVTDRHWCWLPSAATQADPVQGESWDLRSWQPFWSRPSESQERRELSPSAQGPAHGVAHAAAQEAAGPEGLLTPDPTPLLAEQRTFHPVGEPQLVLDEWQRARFRFPLPQRLLGTPVLRAEATGPTTLAASYEPPSAVQDRFTLSRGAQSAQPQLALRRCDAVVVTVPAGSAPPALRFQAVATPIGRSLDLTSDDEDLNAQLHQWLTDLRQLTARRPLSGYGGSGGYGPRSEAADQDLLAATVGLGEVLPLLGRSIEAAPILRGFLEDLLDAEARSGGVPFYVPAVPGLSSLADPGPGAVDALVETLWTLIAAHGDLAVAREGYGALRRVLLTLSAEAGPTGLLHYSDPAQGARESDALTGTATLKLALRRTEQLAVLLGKTADLSLWSELTARTDKAFRDRFVTADGMLVGQSQQALVLALGAGLLPETAQPQALASLARQVRKEGLAVAPGRLCLALKLLSRGGFADLAMGELRVPERMARFQSRYGRTLPTAAVLEWIYAEVLGMRCPGALRLEDLGLRRLQFAPATLAGSLFPSQLAGRFESLRGTVSVRLDRNERQLHARIEIPPDVEVSVTLPGQPPTLLRAGHHQLHIDRRLTAEEQIPELDEVHGQRR